MTLPKDGTARLQNSFVDAGALKTAQLIKDIGSASNILDVTGEEITFVGGVAATGVAAFEHSPICNELGLVCGTVGDTSLVWDAGTILTEEVQYRPLVGDTDFLATLRPGQYAIDYTIGKLFYCKKTAGATDTCSYKTRQLNIQITSDPLAAQNVEGNVEHDHIDEGGPVKIGGWASATLPDPVDEADRVNLAFDLYGRARVLTHSPVIEESLVDTTNVAASAQYYPSSTGMTMIGYRNLSLTGKYIDGDAVSTSIAVQVTNDEDATNADWVAVNGYVTGLSGTWNVAANSVTSSLVTAAAQTATFAWDFDNLNYRYVRVVLTPGDATNTAIIKCRRSA